MDKGKCRSCGAGILWVTMAATGKKNPLDAIPDPEKGNVWKDLNGSWVVLRGTLRTQAMEQGEDLYLSHFATCPNSKQHRKPA